MTHHVIANTLSFQIPRHPRDPLAPSADTSLLNIDKIETIGGTAAAASSEVTSAAAGATMATPGFAGGVAAHLSSGFSLMHQMPGTRALRSFMVDSWAASRQRR